MKKQSLVAWIFAAFLFVPVLLFLVGNLLDNENVRRWGGISAIPFLILFVCSFLANFFNSIRDKGSDAKRRERIEGLLDELGSLKELELVVKERDKSEKIIRSAESLFEVDENGSRSLVPREILVQRVLVSGATFIVRRTEATE